MKEISRGAEAVLYLDGNKLIKDRIRKRYRIEILDKNLRCTRTKREANLLRKCQGIIDVPSVYGNDDEKIIMEFVDGGLVRDVLGRLNKAEMKNVCRRIGESIKKLHDNDIIHGDLTTSNMILKNSNVYFIDFGLGFVSKKEEDKAVDVHLLRQALQSKHYEIAEECFAEILHGYIPNDVFLERLGKVEGRGRYKKRKRVHHKKTE